MLKITKENRDALAQYLDSTNLPHKDVKSLIVMLMSLEEVSKEPEKTKK